MWILDMWILDMWKCPQMVVIVIALAIFALTLYVNYPHDEGGNHASYEEVPVDR